MNITELLRLLRKHLVLLLFTPIMMALLVMFFTRKPSYTYSSETTLYTGIASGSSVEMDKSFSYFANNTAFDNLINVINSRETQQEVAIRMLALHLMLDSYDPNYISKQSFINLRSITPPSIFKLVVKNGKNLKPKKYNSGKTIIKAAEPAPSPKKPATKEYKTYTVNPGQTLYAISKQFNLTVDQLKQINGITDNTITPGQVLRVGVASGGGGESMETKSVSQDDSTPDSVTVNKTFSFKDLDTSNTGKIQPASIDQAAYEQTVANLRAFMAKNDTNFIYRLLYFKDPHYSLDAISKITVQRIGSSDLVRLKYDSDDPGICRQTLALITEVCIENYKNIKENRSDAVVKYFEFQVDQAAGRLKVGEDKLLKFNEDHNIINYYEQSKAVANVKEDLDVSYHNKRIKLAGTQAAIRRIEEKLGNQQQIQLSNTSIIEKRNQLGEINAKIATAETVGFGDSIDEKSLVKLKLKAEKLKEEMRNAVNKLYSYGNTTEGLPIATLLNDWLNNVIDYEDTKAGLDVLGERIVEFQKQYAIYAPAGANIKRIEREINVSEQEFLELLHGLNLAKLKMQDAELSSSIKTVDPPFLPLTPNPTKRSILIIVAGLIGFIIVLGTILMMEYFDETLKNPKKASKILNLNPAGIFPKIFLETGSLNFLFVVNRLLEMIIQQVTLYPKEKTAGNEPRTLLFFSTLSNEGKTVLVGNLALKLKKQGKKVLVLIFSRESLRKTELSQLGYSEEPAQLTTSGAIKKKHRFSFITRLIGYGDTRVDYDSPFLDAPASRLDTDELLYYNVDSGFFSTSHYTELLRGNQFTIPYIPDYVLIELPPILYYPYPPKLIASADIALLVCRANNVWSQADQSALDSFMKLTINAPLFLLNGVELQVIESVLGDLPKKRSRLRRIFKKVVHFQFFTRYQP